MNSVSTVTNVSRRSRVQSWSSASVVVMRAGGGNSGRAGRGILRFYTRPTPPPTPPAWEGGFLHPLPRRERAGVRGNTLLDSPGVGGLSPPPVSPGPSMHAYRTHTCGALRASDAGQTARLSGWVHSKRDHGGLLFIDLRDHHGLTQCVFAAGSPAFAQADAIRVESVITVTGEVVKREPGTVNPRLPTGEIELRVGALVVQSAAEVLPMQVAGDEKFPEEIRLKYRFI